MTEGFYLTVEQVRQAASTWVEAQPLLPRDRTKLYHHTADVIAYYQSRNRQARIAHTQKTLFELQRLDINVKQLRSCVPRDP